MYRKVCTKAAACAMGIMMAGGISAATKEESIRNVVASSPYYRYVTASALIIRTGASTSYSRVGTYLRGTKVACYGTSGNWTKVKYSGKTRYVCSDYLSSTSPDSNTSAYSRYVTASSLNVRSGASMSASVVGSYKEGTKVTCYGTSGSWTKVKYNGETRYVSTQYLSTKAPSSESSSSDTATSAYTRYVTASSLNVRSGASMSASVVGSYKEGTKVTCYGTSGSWTKVKYDGETRYVSTQYLSTKAPSSGSSSSSFTETSTTTYTRYVTASSLNVRSGASTSSSVVGTYREGTKVTCYGTSGSWTKVKYNGVTRYVSTQYLSASAPSSGSSGSSSSSSNAATNSSSKGQWVANYALLFVGNPYVWGGTSLTNGSDCSGFTQSVYKHFGYSIPRTSASQRSAGKAVSWSERQVGDLICYSGHVAIYIGNNKIVHSSNPKDGVKITSPANYTTVLAVRRIVD